MANTVDERELLATYNKAAGSDYPDYNPYYNPYNNTMPPIVLVKNEVQLRIFESSRGCTLEEDINRWLTSNNNIRIKDIKLTCSDKTYLVLVMYTVEA